jgi:nitroimidazol reductase NimA-like FMN-containing flavoprotein (pyridoxamine 5'-phosphate oxidase superfamily)
LKLKKIERARQAIERFLESGTLGFLGLARGGQPYVVPLTYVYRKGKILFHCALTGRKLEYLKSNPQVCFTVGVQSGKTCRHTYGAQCRSEHDSVICFGRARIIENLEERRKTLEDFNRRLQPHPKPIPLTAASQCLAVEITISRMTLRQKRNGNEWAEGKCVF